MASEDDIRPWFDALTAQVGRLDLLDVHTHTGADDPDGYSCSVEELLRSLDSAAGARAVVFTMHEPGGYAPANDRVLREAAESDGRLVPFCRVHPALGGAAEAERCLDAGARGIKLHPRAERFELGDPGVRPLFALASERRVPVLVHAGRGIPALGRHAVEICAAHPEVPLILAHAGICDLAWIWEEAESHPNLMFDTSWWNAADLMALFQLVPPGQILYGSDMPYGTPLLGALMTFRCAIEAGLGPEQIESVAGRQAERILAGEPPLDAGPPPGPSAPPADPLLERVHAALLVALSRMIGGMEARESLDLALLACQVPDDAAHAPLIRSIADLIQRVPPSDDPPGPFAAGPRLAMVGVLAARTPAAGAPGAAP